MTKSIYEGIKLPQRATKLSAGYDIYSPVSFVLKAGDSIKIPTGIKVILDDDKYLAIYPRSGLGFKYRTQLFNTCAIIDAKR
jgi:dUTP pyrophosphatase